VASLVGAKLDHFSIVAEIGRGGMGVVYLADDDKLGRSVALKVLREEVASDADRRARFLREARAAAAVTHPNIATIYEVGEADGCVFLAMELIEGKPLRDLIEAGAVDVAAALDIARGVISALAKAHDKGIIHRDLKPENILVTKDGQAKVVDFGLAKVVRSADDPTSVSGDAATEVQTSSEVGFMGTPAYASPEQARSLEVDHRTDLFSLGVVLYELFTGKRPFQGATQLDLMIAIAQATPASIRAQNPAVPEHVERAIFRCLDKDREARPRSAHDLLRAIDGDATPATAARRPTSASPDRKSELILLERVREFWIDGVLRQAVSGEDLRIDLTRDERLGAVDRGFELAAPRLDEDESPIASDVSVASYFDRRGAALLILGEPGAGKTVTLLELARDLVERATVDASATLPVILSLATWRDAKQPIAKWVVDQLREAYRIPERVGRDWMEGDRLTLLLDGLDEVAPALVADCVRAINAFRSDRGLVPIAVACRRTDYEALPERLKLGAAIQLRTLSEAQVNAFIAARGDKLAPLARALAADPDLAELARTPLMLNIMSLSYASSSEGNEITIAPEAPAQDRRKQLFDRYVERMLKRREGRLPFGREGTLRALTWLARDLSARSETVFQLEQLQPTTLPARPRLAYFAITRLLPAVFFGSSIQANTVGKSTLVLAAWAPLTGLDYALGSKPPAANRRFITTLGSFVMLILSMGGAFAAALLFEVRESGETPFANFGEGFLAGIALSLPLVLALGTRRYRLATGKDIRTVESLRLRPVRATILALLFAIAPCLAFWLPFRHAPESEVTVQPIDPSATPTTIAEHATSAEPAADGRGTFVLSYGELRRIGPDSTSKRAPANGSLLVDPEGRFVIAFTRERRWIARVLDATSLNELRTFSARDDAALPEDLDTIQLTPQGLLFVGNAHSSLRDPLSGVERAHFAGSARIDHERVIVRRVGAAPTVRRLDGAALVDLDLPRDTGDTVATHTLAIDPTGTWIASLNRGCLTRIDVAHRAETQRIDIPGCREKPAPKDADDSADAISFSPDGRRLFVSSKSLIVLDVATNHVLRELPRHAPTQVSFDRNGERVLVLAERTAMVLRAEDAATITEVSPRNGAPPWERVAARMSSDGSTLTMLYAGPRSSALGIVFGIFGGLLALGASLETGVIRLKTRVNEGIHRTARRAVSIALVTATAILLGIYVTDALLNEQRQPSLASGLGAAAVFGALLGLGFGGLDLIQHYVLRALLAARGDLPMRAQSLLDSAVQLIFLRKVGGGYIFIHRLILEHFRDQPRK
jgi:serine/threonine protein kinase